MYQNCSCIARKFIYFLFSFLAVVAYTATESVDLLKGSFDRSTIRDISDFLTYLEPFRLLFPIVVIYLLTHKEQSTRKYLFSFAVLATAYIVGIDEHSLQLFNHSSDQTVVALSLTILSLLVVLLLPKMDLWKKVIVALVVGTLLGFDLNTHDKVFYTEYTRLTGKIFIDFVMMIVAPLIFFSLVSGINSITDTKTLGRIGVKAMFAFLFTSAFAITIGIVLGTVFQPGVGIDLSGLNGAKGSEFQYPNLLNVFLGLLPNNGLGAMVGSEHKANTIQTVFFAMFVGVALVSMGKKAEGLVVICQDVANVMFKIIGFIIKLSPLAVWGLMAWVSGTLGIDAIIKLGHLVGATIAGMGVQYLFLIFCFAVIMRLNPWPFMVKSIGYQLLAFSTTSSKATLPTSMEVCEKQLGVSKSITSFILPLGAAVNMDGTAIYLGLSAVFFAQAFGVDLHAYHYALIIFTSTIAAMGAAGYPGGSLVVMTFVLESIGVPATGIALLIGVDRILDMFRTTINITSDVAITAFIDRTEGTLNEKIYYATTAELASGEISKATKTTAKKAVAKPTKTKTKKK